MQRILKRKGIGSQLVTVHLLGSHLLSSSCSTPTNWCDSQLICLADCMVLLARWHSVSVLGHDPGSDVAAPVNWPLMFTFVYKPAMRTLGRRKVVTST